MIQVLVVDDHMVTRMGIKFFIEEDPNIRVVAEACDGEEGIELHTSLNPDIVLIDINMPKMDGIEVVRRIVSKKPNAKIIVLTGSGSKKEIQDSLSAGAKGYCLKDINYTHLISAIKTVADGESWIDSAVLDTFPKRSILTADKQRDLKSDSYQLSNRELQVLALVVEGKTNKEIASELGLSVDTAKSHLKVVMEKLSVSDRTEAAVKAVRERLI